MWIGGYPSFAEASISLALAFLNFLLGCPYCPEFKTPSEIEYQRHIVLKHLGKPGYPNMASGDSEVAEGTTGCTEEDELFTSVQT